MEHVGVEISGDHDRAHIRFACECEASIHYERKVDLLFSQELERDITRQGWWDEDLYLGDDLDHAVQVAGQTVHSYPFASWCEQVRADFQTTQD